MTTESSTTSEELIARLEKTESGDPKLDARIGLASGYWWIRPGDNGRPGAHGPYTQSLDAIVSLIEGTLPGALYRVEKLSEMRRIKEELPYWASCGEAGEQEAAYHRTAPLALCLAFLKALQAKGAES